MFIGALERPWCSNDKFLVNDAACEHSKYCILCFGKAFLPEVHAHVNIEDCGVDIDCSSYVPVESEEDEEK